ncbi:MAG TPA: ABC transporter permease [Candidatus Sulfopaludibacter sp.]|jgi:putative ABC transport system permease protein|nr:ABC transporter permease [Candidatus Sulfopaludibacter sp.]
MLHDLIFRIRAIFLRSRLDADMDEELRFHLEHQTQQSRAAGISPEEAALRARLAFGGMTQVQEQCRDARGISLLDSLWRDLRYGARMLRKNPGFAAVAVLTLGLAIGADTATFSLVNAVLLRPLPYPEPQRIVMVWGTGPNAVRNEAFSETTFLDYQQQNHCFASMAALHAGGSTLTGTPEPERIASAAVSPEFFDVLGIHALLGRTFAPEDGQPGKNNVVILTHGAWQRRYGSDPLIVGRQIYMNLQPYTVIGVLPASFDFTVPGHVTAKELYLPAVLKRDEQQRGNGYLKVFARLKPGVSMAQAQADLDVVGRRLAERYPQVLHGQTVKLVTLQEQNTGDVRKLLWILLAAVSLVLLIACANVANLQLARASARQKEIAIRSAMGAGRRRVMGQMLTESLLLALLGGAFGTALAWGGLRLLASLAPSALHAAHAQTVDGAVLIYSMAVSLAAGILFGLAPALESSAAGLSDALKQGGRGSAESRGGGRLRSLLMVSEVALSLVLLTGAGLLIRSFAELLNVKPGFDARHVLTLPVTLPRYSYGKDPQRIELYRRALNSMAALPGVHSAGAIDDLPLTSDRDSSGLSVEGRPALTASALPVVEQRSVTPGYFQSMAIPLVAGRDLSDADTADSAPVVLLNQEAARRIFPNQNPLGQRVTFGVPSPQSTWMTVAGIVGDVRDLTLDARPGMEVYQPYQQYTLPYMTLVMRTAGDPDGMAAAARRELHELDRNLPLAQALSMETVLAVSIGQRRFNMLLLTLFAAMALVLAGVGIYGVVSYSVAQRTSEIGLRMALGAARADVLKLVVGRSLALTAGGLAAGLAAASLLTGFLSSMLYGVRPLDPVTFGGVALVLAAVAALASYIPARRAMKVDPMTALRDS